MKLSSALTLLLVVFLTNSNATNIRSTSITQGKIAVLGLAGCNPRFLLHTDPVYSDLVILNMFPGCPGGYNYHEGSCYKFVKPSMKGNDAWASCETDGANLVSIGSAAENDYVHGFYGYLILELNCESNEQIIPSQLFQ